jgi:hypothetical protein
MAFMNLYLLQSAIIMNQVQNVISMSTQSISSVNLMPPCHWMDLTAKLWSKGSLAMEFRKLKLSEYCGSNDNARHALSVTSIRIFSSTQNTKEICFIDTHIVRLTIVLAFNLDVDENRPVHS